MTMPTEFNAADFVRQGIEELRRELLDFTARNKLLSFKHTERGANFIRVVDELPSELLRQLSSARGMRFQSLPHPFDMLDDERSSAFQSALQSVKSRAQMPTDVGADEADDATTARPALERLERRLRDQARVALGLQPILARGDRVNIESLARASGIEPDFDLPAPTGHVPRARRDKQIQTLCLPEELDRRTRKVYEAYQDHIQEKGINVLHAAVGFLEWYEDDATEIAHYAPLLLVPVTIARCTDGGRIVYTLAAEAGEGELNVTLREFLKLRHHVALPAYATSSDQGEAGNDEADELEAWLASVKAAIANKRRWRVRRFATIGTFPFSRIALYNDLVPEGWADDALVKHETVSRLLGGSGVETSTAPMAGEQDYPIDRPDFRLPVPLVVLEADSSQHSAIVDAMRGASFVIQGPPGTGKSQTIANIVAAALDAGKSVLFLAEKSAALNVVASRLKHCGLGPFLFEVHSDKARKAPVLEALAERLEISGGAEPAQLQRKLDLRKALRDKLARYVDSMGRPIGRLARPLHELMWYVNRHADDLASRLPAELAKHQMAQAAHIDQHLLDQLRSTLDELALARDALIASGYTPAHHPWRSICCSNSFASDDILAATDAVVVSLGGLASALDELTAAGVTAPRAESELDAWIAGVKRLPPLDDDAGLLRLSLQAPEQVSQLAAIIESYLDAKRRLDGQYLDPARAEGTRVDELLSLCGELAVEPSLERLAAERAKADGLVAELETAKRSLGALTQFVGLPMPAAADDAIAIVSTVRLFCETPDQVIEARTTGMQAEGAERLIATAGKRAAGLASRERALAQQYDLPRARAQHQPEALYSAADSLAGANVVRMLLPEVRRANKLWRSLARAPGNTDVKTRALQLRELAQHITEERSFTEEPQLKKVLGPEFEGHRADFDLYATASGLLRQAAATMAPSAESLFAAAHEKLIVASSLSIRRVKARFSVAMLTELEQALKPLASTDKTLDVVIEDAKQRAARCAEASRIAGSLLKPGARLVLDRSDADEWLASRELLEWQRRRHEILERDTLRQTVGPMLDAVLSNPTLLRRALNTANTLRQSDYPAAVVADLASSREPGQMGTVLTARADSMERLLATYRDCRLRLIELGGLDEPTLAGDSCRLSDVPLRSIKVSLEVACRSAESALQEWMRYRRVLDIALNGPASSLADAFDKSAAAEPHIADLFELCLTRTLITTFLAGEGRELADLTGTTLNDARQRFATIDAEILKLDAARIAAKTSCRDVPYGIDHGPRSNWTERALIENEVRKKTRHIPLRDLIKRAPRALHNLKPVWMMSPLSVAQYLPRVAGLFDIVIIDEASQMRPADAVGGLARARQAIIVGDPMQLPPTNFFGATVDGDGSSDSAAAGQSSILDLAEARLRQKRILRWHYRSRHQGLIAFSNKHFYDEKLVVFPTAYDDPDLGVEMAHVGGQYLGGGTNPVEAKAIVEHARRLIHRSPDRSIGLVTLNVAQREIVQEEWDRVASSDRKVADYLGQWEGTLEGMFVKNLENVQGDERDVILISTVFGPNENGQVAQNFGPINSAAGHRRLNVLFTRAKRKLVLITSMRSADVLPGPNSNIGVHVLKGFLEYAATGKLVAGIDTGRAADSDFEVHVAEQLRRAGYDAVPQVGVDGYRIDIGVRHPSWPHGFLAGIECDGATYHSGVTVRDRDRLRQQILEGLGWRLYRVWSTDWFRNRSHETTKMVAWLDELRRDAS